MVLPWGSLPVDPTNSSSTGLYYAYATDGSSYEVTSLFESQKDKAQYGQNPLIPGYPEVNAKGSSLALNPLWSTQGLVGYWPLDEGTGTTAGDQSGNGNGGTWVGGSSYAGGKVGNFAGNFNGSSNYVDTNKSFDWSSSQPYSFCSWVNISSGGEAPILSKFGFDYTFAAAAAGGGEWFLYWNSGGGNSVNVSTLTAVYGQWEHLCLSYNSTSSIVSLYQNGSLVGTGTDAGNHQSTSETTKIGAGYRGGLQYLKGLIDDVRIYNRALSASEVQALYNAEK
jgi:hypothetical protein